MTPPQDPIFDSHKVVLSRLYRPGSTDGPQTFLQGEAEGHLQSLMGGFAGGFLPAFVPLPRKPESPSGDAPSLCAATHDSPTASPIESAPAQTTVFGMVSMLFRIAKESQGAYVSAATQCYSSMHGGRRAPGCSPDLAAQGRRDLNAHDSEIRKKLATRGCLGRMSSRAPPKLFRPLFDEYRLEFQLNQCRLSAVHLDSDQSLGICGAQCTGEDVHQVTIIGN
jgi:hypothetical protein